jgi:hypothetical protein
MKTDGYTTKYHAPTWFTHSHTPNCPCAYYEKGSYREQHICSKHSKSGENEIKVLKK